MHNVVSVMASVKRYLFSASKRGTRLWKPVRKASFTTWHCALCHYTATQKPLH